MTFKELLSEGTKSSMMRFAVLITLLISLILSLILGFVLIIKGYRCEEIDWIGCSTFVGSIATLITGVTGMKAIQKKNENK